jgi:hypothetical protein
MAARIRLTIRDWFWFCVVLALAFGWGGHFRYSAWLEENLIANRSSNFSYDEQLARELKVAREELAQERIFNEAVAYATRRMLDRDDQQELSKLIREYYDCQGIPSPFYGY